MDRAKANLYGANITVFSVFQHRLAEIPIPDLWHNRDARARNDWDGYNALSNVYQAISADVGYQAPKRDLLFRNSYSIHIFDEEHATDTADDFKTILKVWRIYCYPLATPIIVQLTLWKLKLCSESTASGRNGRHKLTYRADPTL